ncbi:MAG TPA: hypothetical protein DCZ19_08610 [Porphyromonadaceae bacterium]|nr:hypothetical protein [Porphyromonadaceae bacterium]HCC18758.1 hypothetical protein [Porphyromonadaceae bacterium]
MKRLLSLTLITMLLAVTSSSCAQSRRATDQFDVSDFTTIESSVVANIQIRQSPRTSVTAEGSEEFLNALDVRMDNGKLVLNMEKSFLKRFGKRSQNLVISITTPTLTRIDSEGVGNITIDGTFTSPELTIQSEGVGNITAENLRSEKVVINSQGVGNITLGGTADSVDISSEGVGNVHADGLKAKRAVVSSEGVGNVSCHATEYLKVSSQGIGNVHYLGNPKEKDLSKDGIGKIKAGN